MFKQYVDNVCSKYLDEKWIELKTSLDTETPKCAFPPNPERYVHNFSSATLDETDIENFSSVLNFVKYKFMMIR